MLWIISQIDHEEYGEALALAKAYGLDSDLVYQRQWRKSPVSVATIQDYLVSMSCPTVLFFYMLVWKTSNKVDRCLYEHVFSYVVW